MSAVCGREIFPGTGVESDDDIERDLRRRVELLYHPVGTCRMGDGDDAVVDPQLRVRGVQGLRVADASVMPTIVARQHERADDHDRRARRGPREGRVRRRFRQR